jgi:predicted Zn-dependent protease
MSEQQDAALLLTLAAESTPPAALERFFSQEGVTRRGAAEPPVHGLPTAGAGFVATTADGALEGRVVYVELDGRVYQLLGYAAQARWLEREAAVRATLASFDRLTDPAVLGAQPQRLRIVVPDRAMSLAEFRERYASTLSEERLALLNRLEPGARLQPGRRYRTVGTSP